MRGLVRNCFTTTSVTQFCQRYCKCNLQGTYVHNRQSQLLICIKKQFNHTTFFVWVTNSYELEKCNVVREAHVICVSLHMCDAGKQIEFNRSKHLRNQIFMFENIRNQILALNAFLCKKNNLFLKFNRLFLLSNPCRQRETQFQYPIFYLTLSVSITHFFRVYLTVPRQTILKYILYFDLCFHYVNPRLAHLDWCKGARNHDGVYVTHFNRV